MSLEDMSPSGQWQWVGAEPGGARNLWAGSPGRTGRVKTGSGGVRGTSTEAAGRPGRGFLISSENPFLVREPFLPSSCIRELTMADVAFVVTTIAVFALVAFIAKGVAKL
ncbi:hypothetical protein ACFC0N_22220 [Streptomyces zaomyceticus]|uniref:hypothetical protein n=1 Tax=Streptomyces zaomyceticus TaxID=68286 RepID=UPI0035E151B0